MSFYKYITDILLTNKQFSLMSKNLQNLPSYFRRCDKVAVCCDNKIVSVCDVTEDTESKVIYHDRHMHNNYVRGAAWDREDKKTLHTVGWNGEIKAHSLTWD